MLIQPPCQEAICLEQCGRIGKVHTQKTEYKCDALYRIAIA